MEQATPSRRLYTPDEYFAFEAATPGRHEYRDGEIIAMAGTEPDHTRVVRNLSRRFDERLDGSECETFMLDQRVRTDGARYGYPDVTIACPPFEYVPQVRPRTLTNPRVIIEVLSPSTELDDRVEKFFRYMQIDTLVEYVLVAQNRPRAETFLRDPPGLWRLAGWGEGLDATLHVHTFGFDVPLARVYERVSFPPGAPDPVDEPV